MVKRVLPGVLLGLLITLFAFSRSVYAVSVLIEAPTTELTRGEEYDFVVTIDTFDKSISSFDAKLTYETEYLTLVSVTNGNFFESLDYTEATTGEISLSGSLSEAKAGSGTFAIARFELTAEAAGQTTLCSVVAETTPTPEITPTTAPDITPTLPPGVTPTIAPDLPTKAPYPTAIPTSGMAMGWKVGSIVALGLISLGIFGIILL